MGKISPLSHVNTWKYGKRQEKCGVNKIIKNCLKRIREFYKHCPGILKPSQSYIEISNRSEAENRLIIILISKYKYKSKLSPILVRSFLWSVAMEQKKGSAIT